MTTISLTHLGWRDDLLQTIGLGVDWVWRLDFYEQRCWIGRCARLGAEEPETSSEIALSDAWARVHPEDVATVRRAVDECLASDRVIEVQHRLLPITANGPVRWLHQYARPLRDSSGVVRALVGTARDVTASIVAIHELESRVAAGKFRLREYGHRIQNNFAIIRAVLEMHRPAKEAHDGNEHLSDLIARIGSLTDLSREFFGSGTETPRSVTVALQKLLDSARGALLLPGDELHGQIESDLPPLPGDRWTHLALIFNELLTNATKHRGDRNRPLQIMVSARLLAGVLEVEVEDDGGGKPGFEPCVSSGLGGRLVTICCDQIGATLERHRTERGMLVQLRVPTSTAAAS